MRVVFHNDDLVVPAEAGTRLLDLCDEANVSIPFSCRDASCATCLIDVPAGAELLERPAISEMRLLARIRAEPHQRLACQVKIAKGSGEVRVLPADRT